MPTGICIKAGTGDLSTEDLAVLQAYAQARNLEVKLCTTEDPTFDCC